MGPIGYLKVAFRSDNCSRFNAGPASSYPDIDDNSRIGEHRLCQGKYIPGCRIFYVPRDNSTKAVEIAIDEWKDADAGDAKDQVMVFKYKRRWLAVNHVRASSRTLTVQHQ